MKSKIPPLYLKIYQLIKYLYCVTSQFRKEYKFTLGSSILDLSWNMLDLTVEANFSPNTQKAIAIKKISSDFDKLKLRVRMAHELKLISHRQYGHIILQFEEIGKMLSGWLSWAKKQNIEGV